MGAVREIIFNKKILLRKYLCGVLDVVLQISDKWIPKTKKFCGKHGQNS